ncbi:hypothetical protein RND81_04G151200 [Saponaria officinalis]|uniref:DUF6598 domain-containing protein n=1 Tax=Saponaria officinalis TaxID=3572 RepID=A0AAW1LN65_SAPOF
MGEGEWTDDEVLQFLLGNHSNEEDEQNETLSTYRRRKVQNDDYIDRLSTPLIEVLSVCISSDFNDGEPCEIYGSILALEEQCPLFDLYDRSNPEDSETIVKRGTLSLKGPDDRAIIPSLSPTLHICLKDRIRGVEVVNGHLNLELGDEDSCDRLIKRAVEGAYGVAYVYYVVFQFAVYGTFEVRVTSNDNDGKKGNVADIYGSIVAEYENATMYCNDDDEVKLFAPRLFDEPPHLPLRVLLGTPIRLFRNVLAVPAYSSLSIKVNLCDSNGTIADGCLEFPAYTLGDKTLCIQTQYACVEVTVRWHHAYYYIYKDRFAKYSKPETGKRPKTEMLFDCEPDFPPCIPRKVPSYHFGSLGTEVFSVFVAGLTEKVSTLCGAITVDALGREIPIYDRDDSCPEMLSEDVLASVDVKHRGIRTSEIGMVLYLKDLASQLEVCRGNLRWCVGNLGGYMSFYNLRLCSIVRGDNGYAAVHYTIFDDSFEASVEVKCFCDGHLDNSIYLYGTLFGRYGEYDYSTSYQLKYYSSKLFDQPRDRPVETKAGSQITMLKSKVMVPADSFLIIEANMGALGIDGVEDTIHGTVEFNIDCCSTVTREIIGKSYRVEISVNFN